MGFYKIQTKWPSQRKHYTNKTIEDHQCMLITYYMTRVLKFCPVKSYIKSKSDFVTVKMQYLNVSNCYSKPYYFNQTICLNKQSHILDY